MGDLMDSGLEMDEESAIAHGISPERFHRMT